MRAARAVLALLGVLAGCTDFDSFDLVDGQRCGSRFIDTAAGQCAPGPPLCGCADPATNCVFVGAGAFECRAAGAKLDGESCVGHTDCVRGTACTGGLCRGTCRTVSDCQLALSAQCLPVTDEDGNEVGEFSICAYDCDPVSPAAPIDPGGFAACPAGQTCTLETVRHSGCIGSTGTRTSGACKTTTDCAPGYDCLSDACKQYCWGFDPRCDVGTCTPMTSSDGTGAVLLDVAHVGYCQ